MVLQPLKHQIVDLGINLLQANEHQAAHNRADFTAAGVTCLNLMSSPGAGKTALLEAVLPQLRDRYRLAIIEGDMTTELDAERLRRHGVPVIAINTGRACHLDAQMVQKGLQRLATDVAPLTEFDLVLVENVGNLVCPAEFAVGEHAKVALLSVTEGEDKPLKYPLMFQEADCLVITKADLLPYVGIDRERLSANLRQMNPKAPIFWLSAQTGEGLAAWLQWLEQTVVSGVSV
ncbi:MAG: hydrogenase nickel incorporation protein HypB [Synechococcaceae cyanobacterium SM2_3_60]|nr:hydrogenase nickel incorporation protein HypB [Synechococcaceae cyanobacterium SM2_3_60]